MEWANSPSDLALPPFENQDKRALDDESDDDIVRKKRRVSVNVQIHGVPRLTSSSSSSYTKGLTPPI
jgi:hypothetical protein